MNSTLVIAHIVGVIPLQILINRFYNFIIKKRNGVLSTTQPISYKSFYKTILLSYISLTIFCILKQITPAWAIWAGIVIFGLTNTWLNILFISESARRYMIANMVDKNSSLQPEEIITNYNKKHIIEKRIQRLKEWKCLILVNNHYIAIPGAMLFFAKLIRWWANILGFEWAKDFS